MPKPDTTRANELDIFRGLAALMIVVHHWRFFYFPATFQTVDYHSLPLSGLLSPIYLFGEYAVEAFFTISGYIFFWLYAEAVATKSVDAAAFFRARFARLYPLFFATLILTLVLQMAYKAMNGQDLVYTDNNLVNFVKNIFLVQSWSYLSVQTFNGPAWSISAEVFLYLIFFIFCRFNRLRPVYVLMALVAGIIARQHLGIIGRGIPCLFLGGLAYYAVQALAPYRQRFRGPLLAVVGLLWFLTFVRAHPDLSPALVQWAHDRLPGVDFAPLGYVFGLNSFWGVLMPLTLIALVSYFHDKQAHLQPFAWLGDVSYSLYLLHFPLILVVSLWLSQQSAALKAQVAGSPLVMLAFIAVLLGLARLCHRYFEMPARTWIRGQRQLMGFGGCAPKSSLLPSLIPGPLGRVKEGNKKRSGSRPGTPSPTPH